MEEGEAETGLDQMFGESISDETWMMRRSLVHIKLGILFQAEKTVDERYCWVHQPAMLQKQERGQQNRVKERRSKEEFNRG